jgi:hypothetical protein
VVLLKPVVYFRASLAEEEEKQVAAKYFDIVERRTAVPPGSLVIPRYSALPYNEELEKDIEALHGQLINSHAEHVYIANLRNWYYHIAEYTPRTWFYLDQIPDEGPFVLKGATNSRKHQWSTHMYAENKQEAIEVYTRLAEDGFVGVQPIYVREYVPLRKLCDPVGFKAPPVAEEYRFFVLDGKILASGFYWSNNLDTIEEPVDPDFVPRGFLEEVISCVKDHIRFFVVDVARTAEGNWIVIELNDGQQSGLSAAAPDDLYKALCDALK